jgi:rare lipoprotein A (peptidoglycan hydrolase)
MKNINPIIAIPFYLVLCYWLGFIMAIELSPKPYIQPEITIKHKEIIGIASWYDYKLSGLQWSTQHNTCASRRFKRYTIITVKNLDNGKTVDCYVNDYGPEESTGREIDLSSHAFNELSFLDKGLINVEVKYANK